MRTIVYDVIVVNVFLPTLMRILPKKEDNWVPSILLSFIFENDDFRLLFYQAAHFSTKIPINATAMNNKRFLIAGVFHFVDPVEKDV